MKVTIEINLDNAAFWTNESVFRDEELARLISHQVVHKAIQLVQTNAGTDLEYIFDINGNTIGTVRCDDEFMSNYRDLERQLVAMREASKGLETSEEDQLLEQMDEAWRALTTEQKEQLRVEGPKSLIINSEGN